MKTLIFNNQIKNAVSEQKSYFSKIKTYIYVDLDRIYISNIYDYMDIDYYYLSYLPKTNN